MKELQCRQKKLLQYLLKYNDFKPVKHFAELLSCSDKTIRNDLKYFAQQDIEIEKISNRGVKISDRYKSFISNLLEESSIDDEKEDRIELSTEQRRMKILFDLLNNAKLSIQILSDTYFVSKTSIVNDFKVIEEKLNVYNLKLKKDVSGTKIIGEETNIRKALVDILNQMIKYNNNSVKQVCSRIDGDTLKELEEHFGKTNVKKVEEIIEQAEKFLNYKITEPYYINLVTHILILITRIKQDKTIYSKIEKTSKFSNKDFYKASINMGHDIEKTFSVILNEAEISYIYRYLTSSGGIKETKKIDALDDEYVRSVADDIIDTCIKIFPINFQFNESLYKALLLHLRPMLNRIKYKIFIKNPILDDVKLEFPELMILLKLVMTKMELKYNLSKISEDEIAYLTVYFQSAIEEVINKKSVVIVCSSGVGTSHLLEKRIRKYFPEWNIVDVVSAKQLENVISLNKVDLVIATVNLHMPIDKPVAYVSALFNKTDERRIRESFMKQIPLNDEQKIKTFEIKEKIQIQECMNNSTFRKNIQIESILDINVYESNKEYSKVVLVNNKTKDIKVQDMYVFIKEKNLSDELIKDIYFWILDNI